MYFPVDKLPLHKHGFYNTRSYLIIHLLRRQTQCTATNIQAVRNKIIRQSFLYIRDVKPGINAIAEWERQSGNEVRKVEMKYVQTNIGKQNSRKKVNIYVLMLIKWRMTMVKGHRMTSIVGFLP